MTPAERSAADERPMTERAHAATSRASETPEQIEARAGRCERAGCLETALALRARVDDIREGERRATARIVAALENMTGNYARGVAAARGGDADLVREIAMELALDIAAGRL